MAGKRKTREAKAKALAAVQADEGTASRARACGGPGTPVEQRVRYIAHLMTSGQYDGYVTRYELGKAWGIADGTVREHAAEAHRLVSVDPEERERYRISLASQARRIRLRAERLRNNVTGLPDFPSAISAIKLQATLLGVDIETKRLELTGRDGGPIRYEDLPSLSNEQITELAAGVWPAAASVGGGGGTGEAQATAEGEPDAVRPDAEPAPDSATASGPNRAGSGEGGD